MSKRTISVLIVDGPQRALAPLETSLTTDDYEITVRRCHLDTIDASTWDIQYDAIVLQAEAYEHGDGDIQDCIGDEQANTETIVIADVSTQSLSARDDDAVDKVFELDPAVPAQYQIVATGIREYLVTRNLPASAGDSTLQLPENVLDATEAILLIKEKRFIDCTKAAAELLGYESRAPIRGRHPAELSPPTQPDGQSSAKKVNDVFDVAQNGGYHRFSWVHTRADGREQSVIVSLMPVIHEDTQLLYCVWREPPTAHATGTQSAIEPVLAQSVVAESATPRALVVEAQPGAHLAAKIERAETAMTATAVASVHEAQLALESPESIDCVVLSRCLPDTNATSFLAYVRETHPDVPVVCVGDTVLDSNVTSETEQRVAGLLAETDLRGSDEQPLQRSDRPSAGYQAAFETLLIPIVFFDHRQAIYLNEAFQSALGYDRDSIEEMSLIETVVHSGDRRRVTQLLADWQQGNGEQSTHIVRLCASDGSVRHFEIAGTPLTMAGRSGVVVSFCDVTDQLQAKQQTAFERGLARILLDQVSDAQTQAEFITGVVEGLTQQGYALAWSGTVDGTELNACAVAGDRQFYRTLKTALADASDAGEPIVRAAKTGAMQYIADIETLLAAPWRDAALDAGYRSSIAVPLSSHDTTYGVIAIYSREPDPFNERNRRLLAQFADAVAFASHSFQLQASLAAETVTEAAITVDDGAYYLVELARAGAFDAYPDLQVVGSVRRGENAVLQYLTANGSPSGLQDRLATHPAVTDVAIVTEDDPIRIQVTVTERVPEVDLAAQGVVVRTTAIDPQGAVLSVELPPHAALQSVVERLQTTYGGVTAELQATVDRTMRDWRGGPFERADLTDKQRTALQAAYYNGYFAQPRRSTATEIAASLGVGHSTFLQHLHRAEEKVFASQFE